MVKIYASSALKHRMYFSASHICITTNRNILCLLADKCYLSNPLNLYIARDRVVHFHAMVLTFSRSHIPNESFCAYTNMIVRNLIAGVSFLAHYMSRIAGMCTCVTRFDVQIERSPNIDANRRRGRHADYRSLLEDFGRLAVAMLAGHGSTQDTTPWRAV